MATFDPSDVFTSGYRQRSWLYILLFLFFFFFFLVFALIDLRRTYLYFYTFLLFNMALACVPATFGNITVFGADAPSLEASIVTNLGTIVSPFPRQFGSLSQQWT